MKNYQELSRRLFLYEDDIESLYRQHLVRLTSAEGLAISHSCLKSQDPHDDFVEGVLDSFLASMRPIHFSSIPNFDYAIFSILSSQDNFWNYFPGDKFEISVEGGPWLVPQLKTGPISLPDSMAALAEAIVDVPVRVRLTEASLERQKIEHRWSNVNGRAQKLLVQIKQEFFKRLFFKYVTVGGSKRQEISKLDQQILGFYKMSLTISDLEKMAGIVSNASLFEKVCGQEKLFDFGCATLGELVALLNFLEQDPESILKIYTLDKTAFQAHLQQELANLSSLISI